MTLETRISKFRRLMTERLSMAVNCEQLVEMAVSAYMVGYQDAKIDQTAALLAAADFTSVSTKEKTG